MCGGAEGAGGAGGAGGPPDQMEKPEGISQEEWDKWLAAMGQTQPTA